jgi:hypothetical protein
MSHEELLHLIRYNSFVPSDIPCIQLRHEESQKYHIQREHPGVFGRQQSMDANGRAQIALRYKYQKRGKVSIIRLLTASGIRTERCCNFSMASL